MKLNKKQDLGIGQAVFMSSIGFILMLANWKTNTSISAFIQDSPALFGLLFGIAGSIFFFDGYKDRRNWFDMIIGFSLWGVGITHLYEHALIHYIFASIFFIGNSFNIIYFSREDHRLLKTVMVSVSLILLSLSAFKIYSLFWGETLAILVSFLPNFLLEKLKLTD